MQSFSQAVTVMRRAEFDSCDALDGTGVGIEILKKRIQ